MTNEARQPNADGYGEAPQLVTLEILMDPSTGAVHVNGPIDNRLLCYGLLEIARETIAEHARKRRTAEILRPSPAVIHDVLSGR